MRYRGVKILIKYLTPSLFKRMSLQESFKNKVFSRTLDEMIKTPRPSIKAMKILFNRRAVRGAEIGVGLGLNAENILQELNIEKLYLIDAWIWKPLNYKLVFNKFKGNKKIEVIKYASKDAIDRIKDDSLDFVYIDANHDFEFVSQDIKMWINKVRKGGVIGGHDIFLCFGVLQAVKDFCFDNNFGFHVKFPDWYIVKKEGLN